LYLLVLLVLMSCLSVAALAAVLISVAAVAQADFVKFQMWLRLRVRPQQLWLDRAAAETPVEVCRA
jgi:hypothetical protein